MTTETTTAEVTATETPVTTPAPKKASKPAKAKQHKEKGDKADAPKASGLTGNEIKVLKALKGAKTPLTRKQLATKTEIAKGWSRMLGASTKDDGGVAGKDSLEGRGLIKVQADPEGGRALLYTITKKGEQSLAKAL